MCDKIKVFKLYFKYYGRYLHLYLITALTKVIAIVFVFENFIVFVIVFKYYAMYLDPSLLGPDTYVRIYTHQFIRFVMITSTVIVLHTSIFTITFQVWVSVLIVLT